MVDRLTDRERDERSGRHEDVVGELHREGDVVRRGARSHEHEQGGGRAHDGGVHGTKMPRPSALGHHRRAARAAVLAWYGLANVRPMRTKVAGSAGSAEHGRLTLVVAGAGLAALLCGCFSGDATIGSICGGPGDCGPDQQCRHELCGRCGNGAHEAGELCYGDAVAIPGATSVRLFRIADLDRDDRDELVTLDDDGTVRHWVARGGALQDTVVANGVAFALGDADGDGDGDIVVAAGSVVTVFAADQGGFAAALELDVGHIVAEATVVARTEAPAELAFVDDAGSLLRVELVADAMPQRIDVGTAVHVGPAIHLDDDGVLDLAFVDARQNRMGVIIGGSWGTFVRVDVGRGPTGVVAYDRDGDGRHDFLTLDGFGHTVTLVGATAAGGLRVVDSLAFDRAPMAATALDADFDGVPDVVVATELAHEIWRGDGDRHPEGLIFEGTGAAQLGVARFGALRLLEIVRLVDGRLLRQAVDP